MSCGRHACGTTSPPDELDDPLAKMTPWQIYQRRIWISDEHTNTKILLLALSRYIPKDLQRGCSMSYSQLARDCGYSEATAKRFAKDQVDTKREVAWVGVRVGKGRYVAGKGSENLYFGIIPQKWADELRRRMRGGIVVEADEEIAAVASEVSERYPETDASGGCDEPQREASHRHPEGGAGYRVDTEVSGRPRKIRDRGITGIPGYQRDTTAVSHRYTYFRIHQKRKKKRALIRPPIGTALQPMQRKLMPRTPPTTRRQGCTALSNAACSPCPGESAC
jgi:hypothetical protein